MIITNQKKQENPFRFHIMAKQKKTPLEWWLTNGEYFPNLQNISIKIFSMAMSSAASDRNLLTMRLIHSKLSNSLSTNTAEKLVFINSNLAKFYDCPVPTCNVLISSYGNSEAE